MSYNKVVYIMDAILTRLLESYLTELQAPRASPAPQPPNAPATQSRQSATAIEDRYIEMLIQQGRYDRNILAHLDRREYADLERRRIRILSDIMEDYRRALSDYSAIVSRVEQFMRSSRNITNSSYRTNANGYTRFTQNPTMNRTFMYYLNRNADNEERRGLTAEEMFNSTEILTYDASGTLQHTRCPITLEDFANGDEVMRINTCGHIFRPTALQRWFQTHRECPMCRNTAANQSQQETAEEQAAANIVYNPYTNTDTGTRTNANGEEADLVRQLFGDSSILRANFTFDLE